MSHPVDRLLEWLPRCDFAILEHGFAAHGRDYEFVIEHSGIRRPGQHRLTFTHVVEISMVTQVRDDVWPQSWTDEFIDYTAWERAGNPGGYVWGTNWSLAYPGIEGLKTSERAAAWGARVQHQMYEVVITADRLRWTLIFHEVKAEKLNDQTDLVSKVIIPLH